MPRDRKPLTLRERARAWWQANGRSFDEALPPGEQGYLAGWHARGRADRLAKAERAVIFAAQAYCRSRSPEERHRSMMGIDTAVANLDHAKGRK